MDVQQKIAKSLRPLKTPIEFTDLDLDQEKSACVEDPQQKSQRFQDGLGDFFLEQQQQQQQQQAEGSDELFEMPHYIDNVVLIEDDDVQKQVDKRPSDVFQPDFSTMIDPQDEWIDPDTLPIPESLQNDKGDTKLSPTRDFIHRKRYLILGLFVLVAVIVIVVGVVISLSLSSSSSATQPPSPAPTFVEQAIRDTLQDLLEQESNRANTTYQLPPATLDWLVQYTLSSNMSSEIELHIEELVQLAASVAIYELTLGSNWTFKEGWLSFDIGICDWFGVDCDDAGLVVTKLDLPANRLRGTVPQEVGLLTNLGTCAVVVKSHVCCVWGVVRSDACVHIDVVSLRLHDNMLKGTLPSTISLLTALSELSLSSNELTGEFPLTLPPNLTSLALEFNSFAGTLPDDLFSSKLTSLEVLELGANGFFGSLPPSLGLLTRLITLSLHNNEFTGNLESINLEPLLTDLHYLVVSRNKLTGTLPEFLSDMPDLRWLLFDNNALGGSIPSTFGRLLRVQRLDLSNTGLTGTLPPSLSSWRNMETLKVASNKMNGTIPTEYGLMTSLQSVDLSRNFFTGTIPMEVSSWTTLLDMDVSSNELTGTMPDYQCSRTPPPTMIADCGGSEDGGDAELVCRCCSTCL